MFYKYWGIVVEEIQVDGRIIWIVHNLDRPFPLNDNTNQWVYGLNTKLMHAAIHRGVERIIDQHHRFSIDRPNPKMLKLKEQRGEYIDLPSKIGREDMRIYLFGCVPSKLINANHHHG